MKIYISGPVSALGEPAARVRFLDAKIRAEKNFPKHEIVTPFDLGIEPNPDWADAMDVCIDALYEAGAIIMLDGWERSNGARIEHKIALHEGIIIFNERCLSMEGGKE